jgi:hypothetical protein
LLAIFFIVSQNALAYQQPATRALLDVTPDKVTMELEGLLSEMELAFGMA